MRALLRCPESQAVESNNSPVPPGLDTPYISLTFFAAQTLSSDSDTHMQTDPFCSRTSFSGREATGSGNSDQMCILGPGRDSSGGRVSPSIRALHVSLPHPHRHQHMKSGRCDRLCPGLPASNSSHLPSFLFTVARLFFLSARF